MVAFNPDVAPGRDDMPNWQRAVGGPISDLVPDKSAGIGLQTAGNAIEGATEIADTQVKKSIDTDVRDKTEGIRQDFTNDLEAMKARLAGNNILPANATPTQGGSTPAIPAAVDSTLSKVDNLQSALINGKINDTYYHGRLKDAVTQLRSQYPGYTDYIDQKVSQITGVNPANAYVSDLMQDINRMQTTKKSAVDKAVDDAMKSGYPNSGAMIQRLQQDGEKFLPQFQQWYSQNTEFDATIKRKDAMRSTMKGSKEDINTQRTEDFTNEVGSVLTTNFNSISTIAGTNTPQGILDTIKDAAAHPDKYTDAQMRQLSTVLKTQEAAVTSQLLARSRQTQQDAQGRTYSYSSDVGPAKIQEIIQNQVHSAYKTITDALDGGGVQGAGAAFAHMNHAKAKLDDTKDNLLSSDVGTWAAKMSNFNELMGPNWTGLVTNAGLKADIDDKMRGYLSEKTLDARLQPEFDKTGKPITLKQHMDEALQLQQQGKITAAQRSRYTGNLINIVDDIKNKDAPDRDKQNVVRYLFSPEGQGILNGIKTDYVDPDTGKQVPGKYSVFQRLTSDDVVKEIAKMPDDLKMMYKNYMEREAGANLFYKEFQNLNYFAGHDDLHFKYNDASKGGKPYIELLDDTGKPIQQSNSAYGVAPQPPMSAGYKYQVQKVVDRINTALSGMTNVEKAFGGNASDYALAFMIRSQVDLGKNWEGLPAKLLDSIARTRVQRKLEDTFKDQGGK
jgi:hypothetical protein